MLKNIFMHLALRVHVDIYVIAPMVLNYLTKVCDV